MHTAITIVIVVAVVGYVLFRRLRGEPLQAKRLLVLPAIFTIIGFVDLTKSGAPHLTSTDDAFLIAGGAISLALGAARGATITIFTKEGHLWQRYRRLTVVLWVVLIAVKLALGGAASAAGASAAAGTHNLLLPLGLSLLGEAALVAPRAFSTGVPLAPDTSLLGGLRGGGGGGSGRSGRPLRSALDRLSEPRPPAPGAGPHEPPPPAPGAGPYPPQPPTPGAGPYQPPPPVGGRRLGDRRDRRRDRRGRR